MSSRNFTTRKIYTTTDYSVFKFIDSNRSTSSNHVRRLMDSISTNDLTIDLPIIVNEKMEILDGQNRFEALKLLNYPINYIVAEKMNIADISLINSMGKRWSMEDYLKQYVSQNKIEYVKFRNFMTWADLSSCSLALKLLKSIKHSTNERSGGLHAGGNNSEIFKIGKFIYPENDSRVKKNVLQLKELSKALKNKNPYDRSLIVSYDLMTSTEGFDFDRLVNKLQTFPIGAYNDANSLIYQFENAYNYNVPHKNKIIFRRAK